MAVAFDAAVARNQNAVSSDSWSHTCTGSDRYLVVAIGVGCAQGMTVSVTYNGVSMSSIGLYNNTTFGSGAAGKAQLFGLVAPATGANTVAVTYSAGSNVGGAASISYTGVHQTSPVGTAGTNTGQNNIGSTVTITDSVTGDMVVSAIVCDGSSSGLTAGDTQRMSEAASGYQGGASDAAGAASVAMDWSWTSSVAFAHVAVALKQVSAGVNEALSGSAVTTGVGTQSPGTAVPL